MKYRKKPIVIEAEYWDGNYPGTIRRPSWFELEIGTGSLQPKSDGKLLVHTLEGTMVAERGDWIIQGVKGELYPCKPDIFIATYESVQ